MTICPAWNTRGAAWSSNNEIVFAQNSKDLSIAEGLRLAQDALTAHPQIAGMWVEEDDLTTAFYENDAIDLGQLMREQVYLSLPMKPLCRDDCRGLCPVCGTNLNLSVCHCAREWDDPRFAALKALKGGMTKPREGR